MKRKTWETVDASMVEAIPKSTSSAIHPDGFRIGGAETVPTDMSADYKGLDSLAPIGKRGRPRHGKLSPPSRVQIGQDECPDEDPRRSCGPTDPSCAQRPSCP